MLRQHRCIDADAVGQTRAAGLVAAAWPTYRRLVKDGAPKLCQLVFKPHEYYSYPLFSIYHNQYKNHRILPLFSGNLAIDWGPIL